jgi:hypothetical protein
VPADSCQTRVSTLKHVLQFPTAHSPPLPSSARSVASNFRDDAVAGILATVQARSFQCPTTSVVPFFAFLIWAAADADWAPDRKRANGNQAHAYAKDYSAYVPIPGAYRCAHPAISGTGTAG